MSDRAFAAIVAWLQAHGLTGHAKANGTVILRDKATRREVARK
jgi:hypothetical protein